MARRVPALSSLLALVLLLAALLVGLLWHGTSGPAPAYAIDPNDPAMVLDDHDPCTAPCWKTGIVYRRVASGLNPAAGRIALAMDLFRSKRTPGKDAPVVVLAHGGGFVEGERTQMRKMAEVLANAGFLTVSIDYRLVAKDRNNGLGIVKQPDLVPAAQDAAEDMVAAMNYLRAHAKAFGATKDRGRYAVGGYSAGAITALHLALRFGDRSTPRRERFRVGAGFGISGTECGTWSKAFGCTGAYDEDDPPIAMFNGEADSIVSFSYGRDTCKDAILKGGGCQGYAYPDQDHFWSSGTIFGGGKGLNKAHPAVVPTVAAFLRKQLRKG